MRIVFLCGSLEQGRDGVGDYTRRLARELSKSNHEVALISLNDRYIQNISEEDLEIEGVIFKTIRLARTISWKVRIERAKEFVNSFNPQWLSLQFVPFSFQNKGMPWSLANQLKKLGTGRNWHIMFHELWVGMEKKASFKHRFLGRLQKIIIKRTINVLAPKSIYTQTRLYQVHLEKLGFKAEILPLFGNIPNLFPTKTHNEHWINIAVFGGIHHGAKLKKLIKELPKTNHYKFHFIGNNGPGQEEWVEILVENKIEYELYGWMGMREVSKVLSKCQWGLTTTPYYLSEKSGSAAAMLEHNLTVFCIARKWKPRNMKLKILTNDSIIKWKSNLDLERLLENNGCNSKYCIEEIGRKFINGLKTIQS